MTQNELFYIFSRHTRVKSGGWVSSQKRERVPDSTCPFWQLSIIQTWAVCWQPLPTEQHNVVTALQNVASLHAVQLCYSVGSSLCNVVNGTRKAVNCNVVQRCGGSCTTLPNVIQRCAMLSYRCQTLSNVVQRCNKAVRCCIKAVQRFKLYNAAIVQRCATLPNVIQRNATL